MRHLGEMCRIDRTPDASNAAQLARMRSSPPSDVALTHPSAAKTGWDESSQRDVPQRQRANTSIAAQLIRMSSSARA